MHYLMGRFNYSSSQEGGTSQVGGEETGKQTKGGEQSSVSGQPEGARLG